MFADGKMAFDAPSSPPYGAEGGSLSHIESGVHHDALSEVQPIVAYDEGFQASDVGKHQVHADVVVSIESALEQWFASIFFYDQSGRKFVCKVVLVAQVVIEGFSQILAVGVFGQDFVRVMLITCFFI